MRRRLSCRAEALQIGDALEIDALEPFVIYDFEVIHSHIQGGAQVIVVSDREGQKHWLNPHQVVYITVVTLEL